MASVVGLPGSGKTTAIRTVQDLLTKESINSASFHDRTADVESARIDTLIHMANFSPEARMTSRGGKAQIFDSEAEAFHDRVRQGYLE